MDYINKNLEESTRKVALLKSLPLYEFLLSIEKAYQENNELVSFSFKYVNERSEKFCEHVKTKDDKGELSISSFENSIRAFPTDKEGIKSFIISSAGLHNISVWENKYSCGDSLSFYDFQNDFKNILKEFSLIESRESRFGIYKKFLHGKMPGYSNVIEDWKNGDTTNVIKKENFINLFADTDVNEKTIKSLSEHINKAEQELDKFLFMNSFLKKKLIFSSYPEVEYFVEGIETNYNYKYATLNVSGKGVQYAGELPKEALSAITAISYEENIYKAPERFYSDNRNITTRRDDFFADSQLLDFFKISKEEATLFDSMVEKEMLMKNIDMSSDNNSELKNKKRL